MSELAKKKATYEDLYNIPENMTGEIIDGELIVTPETVKEAHLGCLRVGRRNHAPLLPWTRWGTGRMDYYC